MGIERHIVNVNEYDLVGSADEFVAAIEALAERTKREGHPGVLRYSFYVDRDSRRAGATIVYEDADAWIAHHQIAYQWDEMPALQATVKLNRLAMLGPVNDEMAGWLAESGLDYVHYDAVAAAFER